MALYEGCEEVGDCELGECSARHVILSGGFAREVSSALSDSTDDALSLLTFSKFSAIPFTTGTKIFLVSQYTDNVFYKSYLM